MPFYKITIIDTSGKVMQGIRFNDETNIDIYYSHVYIKAQRVLKDSFADIDVIMLSTYSPLLENWRNNDPAHRQPPKPTFTEVKRKQKGQNNSDWGERCRTS